MKVLALAIVMLGMALPAYALIFGGSNLGLFGYPSHTCIPPYSKPYRPLSFEDQWQVDQYNSEVESYNYQMQEYFNCINTYVENAQNDILRIKEAANAAILDANNQ